MRPRREVVDAPCREVVQVFWIGNSRKGIGVTEGYALFVQ